MKEVGIMMAKNLTNLIAQPGLVRVMVLAYADHRITARFRR